MSAKDNCVFVNREVKPPGKDFKTLIENNRITKIGVKLSGPNVYFCAPMYKLSRLDVLCWLYSIDDFVKRGEMSCYAEDTFNKVSGQIVLRPLYFKEFCMEIDTVDDLEKARAWLERGRKKITHA